MTTMNTQEVLNRTIKRIDGNLGQIRILETQNGIVIEHHVTERERLYSEYSNFAVKTAQSTVEMCRVVFEAKTSLTKDEYLSFLKDIGHKSETSTIRKYLAIGKQYDKLIQYTHLLSNSWTSIYTITQLPSETFDALAMTDTDMSVMSGKQIKSLIEMNKQSTSITSASSQTKSSNSLNTTNCANTSSLENQSIDETVDHVEATSDSVTEDQFDWTTSYNNSIDVVSTDDTFEVLVRFKSKPTNDQWWDLTEAIDTVMDERNLDIEVIETRPLYEKV
jgi:ribosomal protein S8